MNQEIFAGAAGAVTQAKTSGKRTATPVRRDSGWSLRLRYNGRRLYFSGYASRPTLLAAARARCQQIDRYRAAVYVPTRRQPAPPALQAPAAQRRARTRVTLRRLNACLRLAGLIYDARAPEGEPHRRESLILLRWWPATSRFAAEPTKMSSAG